MEKLVTKALIILGVWANEGTTHHQEGAVVLLIGYKTMQEKGLKAKACLLHELDHLFFVFEVWF